MQTFSILSQAVAVGFTTSQLTSFHHTPSIATTNLLQAKLLQEVDF
jgi:hypothetical protein